MPSRARRRFSISWSTDGRTARPPPGQARASTGTARRSSDALPRHNASGAERYTWRNDLERFPPGILDRIIYSDSVLASVNQFVLDTTTMSHRDLVGAGLRAIDVMRDPQAGIHDHFPLVIDVAVRPERRRPRPALP